jgi:hypothetical protein
MPLEFESMKRKHRKAGKSAAQAEKLAIAEYNAKFPGKPIGGVKKAKKAKKQG